MVMSDLWVVPTCLKDELKCATMKTMEPSVTLDLVALKLVLFAANLASHEVRNFNLLSKQAIVHGLLGLA